MDAGNVSSVAAYAMNLKMANLQESAGVSVLKQALEVQKMEGAMLASLMASASPNIGQNVNTYA